ncbi:MAG: hypothetical protein ACFCU3_06650 [Verrucomicrobiales bacterium]
MSKLPKTSACDPSELLKNSALYKEFLAEREEILRHKWIESEKEGQDIGFEKALLDWIVKYRSSWKHTRPREMMRAQTEVQLQQ